MKKTIYIFGITTSMIFLMSCGGNSEGEGSTTEETVTTTEAPAEEPMAEEPAEEASIVGVWQMTDMDMGMAPPAGHEEEFKAAIQKSIDATKYTFNEDGSMNIASEMGPQTGTYSVNGSTLSSTVGDKSEDIEIKELTTDKLVLGVTERGSTMTMTFAKQ